jgi:hypothetical protein
MDLIALDEVGYVPLAEIGAECLFVKADSCSDRQLSPRD